jgi:hypothetical protein
VFHLITLGKQMPSKKVNSTGSTVLGTLRYMKRFFYLILSIFFLASYVWVNQAAEAKSYELVNMGWMELSYDPDNIISEPVIHLADITLPKLTAVEGKAKYIEDISGSDDSVKLGYLFEITVASLDLQKVPEKYKKEWVVSTKLKIVRPPIEQVEYKISFVFDLKDKDGFVLKSFSSKEHSIRSGKINRIQDIASADIPIKIANKIKTIVFRLFVSECITCANRQLIVD